MKVLIVARKGEDFSPFVCEQMSALRNRGIEIDSYGIEGKGLWMYLSKAPLLFLSLRRKSQGAFKSSFLAISCIFYFLYDVNLFICSTQRSYTFSLL